MPKTAFIIDSVCSLPSSLIKKYGIRVLPIEYSVDEERFIDPCDSQETLAIFESGVFKRKHELHTSAPTPIEYEQAIIEQIKAGYGNVVVQTVSRQQSQSYENALAGRASVRQKLDGRDINIVVIDSASVLSGQGLMITETVARSLKGQPIERLEKILEKLSKALCTYILPKEPLIALERLPERNEKNLSWAKTFIANTLNIHPIVAYQNNDSEMVAKVLGFNKAVEKLLKHTAKNVEKGLLSSMVLVSYGGPIEVLTDLPGYSELQQACKANKVLLIPSVMSIAGGIYTGVGSLTVSIAANDLTWSA